MSLTTMASPGVQVNEIDQTQNVTGIAPTVGAYAGIFAWGPIGQSTLVVDEVSLSNTFGTPSAIYTTTANEANYLATSFITGANYLGYSSGLRISRVAVTNDATANNNTINAVASVSGSGTPILVKNVSDFTNKQSLGTLSSQFLIAKYAGIYGNNIGVSIAWNAGQYSSAQVLSASTFTLNKTAKTLSVDTGDLTTFFLTGDYVTFQYNGVTYKNQVVGVSATTLTLNSVGYNFPNFPASATSGVVTTVYKQWQYASLFSSAPLTGEFHVVVYDATGNISGVNGGVLESFGFVSNTSNTVYADGTPAYYQTVINNSSQYLWVGGADISSALAGTGAVGYKQVLSGGRNGALPNIDDYVNAYSVWLDTEIDIFNIITPPLIGNIATSDVVNYLIQNIAEVRKDCVVWLSPRYSDVVGVPGQEINNSIAFRNQLPSSSYAFMDSGWKYTLDKYNNTFRWVPLCGDTAGTSARSDSQADVWYSNAGYNRGSINGVAKLAYNPSQTVQRDQLYQNGINPVVTFNGAGTILYGDKTLLSRPSSFDRINVRKLFIVLEKTIRNAAKYSLFEFNDDITRNRFVAMVDSYLREVMGRRGITAYKVVCDTTNNTPQIINANQFVGDVYIQPNKSINFIQLNFINQPTGATFTTSQA